MITNLSSSNHHHHHLYVGLQHDAAQAVARDVHRPAQPRLGRLVLAVVQSTGDLQGVGEVADPGLRLRVKNVRSRQHPGVLPTLVMPTHTLALSAICLCISSARGMYLRVTSDHTTVIM